ncbi:Transporter [hydrothermal vent metagenome]|uniref:Transporter n=1 Tax=hydrothermal vent metagenome TaxID=652676 RepID=A0A3B0RX72_9ZZZZ
MDVLVLLILAGAAVLILLKLYSVLGQDVGMPAPPTLPARIPVAPTKPEESPANFNNISFAGLAKLQAKDPNFDPGAFLQGARSAYEIVVGAYAAGDRETLKNMLEDEVYANYDKAISEREAKEESLQIDIVRMTEAKLVDANIENKTAYVIVEFQSDLSMMQKDKQGEILDAENTGPAETIEQWTFARPLNSRNPNWRLSAVAAIA